MEEEDEEEERAGRCGGEHRFFPSGSRCEAPFNRAPGRSPRMSRFFEAMLSKAFSMLSLRPRRSANQQSTSVLDSRVSWASRSAAPHRSVNQRS